MQTVATQHLYLFLTVAVVDTLDAVPGVEVFMISVFYHPINGVWGDPDTLGFCHAVEVRKTVQLQCVVRTYEHRVVPTAGADDGPVRRLLPTIARLLVKGLFYLPEVSCTDRQVKRGKVYGRVFIPWRLRRSTERWESQRTGWSSEKVVPCLSFSV